MTDIYGAKVVIDERIADNRLVTIGSFDPPPEWESMTQFERVAYAISRKSTVYLSPAGYVRLTAAIERAEKELT